MRQVQLPIVSVVRKFLSIRCSHGYVYRRLCSHCHRVQPNEKTRSLCGSTCRKRKGTQLVQNALRWPAASNSTNKAPIPTQLKKLVRKYPQWEEELHPLFKATEIVLNVSRCELCTSSCTKSKPPKPRRAKPEIVPESYAAVLSVVTQPSSLQTAASIRTACLSFCLKLRQASNRGRQSCGFCVFCVCVKSKQPIMSQQIDH